MQIQLGANAGRKGGLRQVREEQFVDHTFACDTHWALLFAYRMGGHYHAVGRSLGAHRDLGTIVEAANHLAFWALLNLIRRQVQTRLKEWVIERPIFFATGN